MNIINAFILSFIAGISTLFGSLIILFNIPQKHINNFIIVSLSFSISIMIGISIIDLLPTSFLSLISIHSLNYTITTTLLLFIMGIIIIYVISKYLIINDSFYKLGIISMIVLILHNFPEGIITFISSLKDPTLGLRIGIAIIMHNIPEGISIAIPIYYSTKSKKKAIFNAFLSGISEPLGALFAYLFLSGYFNTNLLSYLLIIVSGMMISLSINEILPVCISYNNSKYVYSGLLLGLLILIINSLL